MRHFVPHAVIVLALLALAGGHVPENACLVALAAGHLLVPVWAAWMATPATKTRAMMLGPGLVIGVHALGIVLALLHLGMPDERNWLAVMVIFAWAGALGIYTLYCILAWSITTRVRR